MEWILNDDRPPIVWPQDDRAWATKWSIYDFSEFARTDSSPLANTSRRTDPGRPEQTHDEVHQLLPPCHSWRRHLDRVGPARRRHDLRRDIRSTSLAAAIADGALETLAWHSEDPVALADVRLAPVIPSPGKIICIGVNYRTHQDEFGKTAPAAPIVFTRFADSQMGHLEDAQMPALTMSSTTRARSPWSSGRRPTSEEGGRAGSHRRLCRVQRLLGPRLAARARNGCRARLSGHRRLRPLSRPRLRGRRRHEAGAHDPGQRRGAAARLCRRPLSSTSPQIIDYVTASPPRSRRRHRHRHPGGVGLFMEPPGFVRAAMWSRSRSPDSASCATSSAKSTDPAVAKFIQGTTMRCQSPARNLSSRR